MNVNDKLLIEKCVKGLHRSLSALNWLPPDSGPVRKQAGDAIYEIRQILDEVEELYPDIMKKVF